MKILKNKFLVGLVCIILGLVVGFIAIPATQNGSHSQMVNALRLKQNVPAGSLILDEMLETIEVSQNTIPSSSFSSLSEISGKYSASDLYAGDFLTAEKLVTEMQAQDPMKLATAKGMKVMSITVNSLAAGVSGKLQPGDVVSIMALIKNNTADQSQTLEPQNTGSGNNGESQELNLDSHAVVFPELQYLEVCSLSAADGSDAQVKPAPFEDIDNKLPATVSLFVTDEQASRLAYLEQKGLLHLSFVARGADTDDFIPADRHVLNVEEG
ncbi:MAG: Flp pilus assembly protein CpaB [Clostridiaceae bacterium]|nr:Flp pilus assembly protein CpaB [Clostridiaceae bacterium]